MSEQMPDVREPATGPAMVATSSGIAVPTAAAETATALAVVVRELTAGLPFGTEPAEFLATLERLAEPGASA